MESLKVVNGGWSKSSSQIFWGEIAPYEHVVQIYDNDDNFLELLSGFIADGVNAGDGVVVIATTSHLDALAERLSAMGFSVSDLVAGHHYIPLDAQSTLSRFMVHDWPEENLFNQVVNEVIFKAKGNGRKVRAFGEMVAILWAKGQVGATVRLEQLWNKFCEREAFCLFCAYPETGFTQDAAESVRHICGAHSKLVTAAESGGSEVLYRSVGN